ncbi:MAG: hypothetical protein GTO49_10320 [Anaerolineae bacterium]|nr:hypothetical protein [Anaerolineae bacterium]
MTEKSMRRLYEPPLARDLSAFGVSGQIEPRGVCVPGAKPYEQCLFGPDPEGQNPPCEPGMFADDPACSPGSNAATICKSGSAQV